MHEFQKISRQNFSLPKSNFWCRKQFSTKHSTISESTFPSALDDNVHTQKAGKFGLSKQFLSEYKDVIPPFGFNGLGELVYRRTYSRLKENGEKEQWYI